MKNTNKHYIIIILLVMLIISILTFNIHKYNNTLKSKIINSNAIEVNYEINKIDYEEELNKVRNKYNNNDIVGILSNSDDTLNEIVMQSTDNDYYLEHLFDGNKNHMGCIFMDYENQKDFSDKNTFIYGHHTNTGTMFYSLESYKDQNYYNKHKTLFLETKDANYVIKPFAGLLVKGTDFFIQITFKNNEEFMNYVRSIRKESVFESPVTVKPSDKLVTMVTCTDDFYDARLAIFCVLEEA